MHIGVHPGCAAIRERTPQPEKKSGSRNRAASRRAISGVGTRLIKFNTKTGKRLDYWGMYGTFAGAFDDPHFISVDSEGSLYVAIFSNNKIGIEKYVPRPGADKARLIGPNLIVK